MKVADFLIEGAAQLATPLASATFSPGTFTTLTDASVASYRGDIVAVGPTSKVMKQVRLCEGGVRVSGKGRTLTPGLIDCHTHPVFSRTREDEFEMRGQGRSYEEISRSGGGILASVRHLRQTSKEELVEQTRRRLDRFLRLGTTTIEAKSGYGLTLADELKMLEVLAEIGKSHPVEIHPTFLGAHEVPDEYRDHKSGYLELVKKEMLPEVMQHKLAVYCDVFCESHVFSVRESEGVLAAAKDLGFHLKIHSEQLGRIGGTSMAAGLGAVSADHLDYTIAPDWQAMLKHQVVPVLLPGAVFFLRKHHYADGRRMWDLGLPVAIATDFNPGSCMSESMPLMLTLACLKLGLTPAEALTAATWHAALALRNGNLLGTIEVGKKADFVLWEAPNFKHLPYHFGVNLVDTVVKTGKVVYQTHH